MTSPSSELRCAVRRSRLRQLVSAGLVLAALVGIAPRAVYAEPTAAARRLGQGLSRDGKELRAKGDHDGALKKFAAAYSLVPSPITGLALAGEQAALGQLLEARETLGAINRMPVRDTESADGRRARVEAATLYADVGARIPVLTLTLLGLPAGTAAVVSVDGHVEPLVALEAGFRVSPGKHIVVVTSAGTVEQRVEISVAEREHRALSVTLTPASKPTEPIHTLPPTTGDAHPSASTPTPSAPAGSNGDRPASRSLVWPLTIGGLGVVSIGVGSVLALTSKSSYDSAKSTYCATGSCDATGKSQIGDARSRGDFATGFFIAGGVLVATGQRPSSCSHRRAARRAYRRASGPAACCCKGASNGQARFRAVLRGVGVVLVGGTLGCNGILGLDNLPLFDAGDDAATFDAGSDDQPRRDDRLHH